MELTLAHPLSRDLEAVTASLLDPGFVRALAARCPALAEGRLLDYRVEGDLVTRVAWFRAAPADLGPHFARLPSVCWVERVRWSREAHEGRFVVEPELPDVMTRRVRCEGVYVLAAHGPLHTVRTVRITLSVRAPLLGAAVEARLGEMLRAIFDDEAALLGGGP
ncbi:MAG: DUF2505 family protein [Polyangiales bacterium]